MYSGSIQMISKIVIHIHVRNVVAIAMWLHVPNPHREHRCLINNIDTVTYLKEQNLQSLRVGRYLETAKYVSPTFVVFNSYSMKKTYIISFINAHAWFWNIYIKLEDYLAECYAWAWDYARITASSFISRVDITWLQNPLNMSLLPVLQTTALKFSFEFLSCSLIQFVTYSRHLPRGACMNDY